MSEIWQQNSMTRVWCHLNFVIFNRFTVRRIIHESIWDVHYVCVCINIYLYLYNHHISQKTVDSWTLQGWGIHSKQSTHPCLTLTSVFHIWGPSVVQVPPYLQLLSHGFSLLLMLQYCGIYWKKSVYKWMYLLFSHQVVSESLRPHGLKHARHPCECTKQFKSM